MSIGGDASRPSHCRSCNEPLHGPYCSACGESHVYGRLELPALVDEVLDGLVNLDTRVLRTVGDLTVAPAKVCRDYLDGRRVAYINPFKYALATFALAFAIVQLRAYLHGMPSDPTQLVAMRWGQLVNLLLLPVAAALLMPLFVMAPRKLTYAEHYVVVLYSFGHAVLLQGLLNPIVVRIGDVAMAGLAPLPVAILSWVAIGVYETRWWTTIPRIVVVYMIIKLAGNGAYQLLS